MNSSIKKIYLTALCVLLALCTFFTLITAVDVNKAKADGTVSTEYDFAMVDGANVKMASFENGATNAIRFVTKLKASDITLGGNVKVVTIITLAENLEEAEITDANFKMENLDNVKYSSVVFSESNGNIPTPKADGYYHFNACIYNIKDVNYTKKFAARSYITDENGNITQYTAFNSANNSRALWDLADYWKNNYTEDDLSTYGPNSDMTAKDYFSTLCQEYTITAKGFDGATSEFTVKHGQTIADNIDYASLKTALNIDGTAYVNGTVTEGDINTPILADATITLGMNALAFNEYSDGLYEVSIGTLTADDTTVIKIPAEYDNKTVKKVAADGFRGNSFITSVFCPDTLTVMGNYAFAFCSNLTHVKSRGVSTYYSASGNGNNIYLGCKLLDKVVVGRNVDIGPQVIQTTDHTATLDIYYDKSFSNSGSTKFNLSATQNANQTSLFTKHVYIYSETDIPGGFYYDEDGVATPYNKDSYLTYNGAGKTFVAANDALRPKYTYDATNGYYTVSGHNASLYTATDSVYNGLTISFPEDLTVNIESSYDDGTYDADVKAVNATAFRDYNYNTPILQAVKKIIVADSVTTVGNAAFARLKSLEYVQLRGVASLSNELFQDCINLKSLVLGERSFDQGAMKCTLGTGNYTANVAIFYDETFKNGGAALKIASASVLFSQKVYRYSATKADGCFYYDTNGVAIPWDENSYYELAFDANRSFTLVTPEA